jgi:hypothetical protein
MEPQKADAIGTAAGQERGRGQTSRTGREGWASVRARVDPAELGAAGLLRRQRWRERRNARSPAGQGHRQSQTGGSGHRSRAAIPPRYCARAFRAVRVRADPGEKLIASMSPEAGGATVPGSNVHVSCLARAGLGVTPVAHRVCSWAIRLPLRYSSARRSKAVPDPPIQSNVPIAYAHPPRSNCATAASFVREGETVTRTDAWVCPRAIRSSVRLNRAFYGSNRSSSLISRARRVPAARIDTTYEDPRCP